jgi:hypothetical protein
MNCREFQDIAADLSRGQPREGAVMEQALLHAKDCAACAMLLAAEERLSASLGALAAQDRRLQAPAALEGALLGQFRALNRTEPAAAARSRLDSGWWVVAAAAAAVLLAVWLGPWRQQPSPPRGTVSVNVPERAMNVPEGTSLPAEPRAPALPPIAVAPQPPAASTKSASTLASGHAAESVGRGTERRAVARTTEGPGSAAEPAQAAAEIAVAARRQEVVTEFVPLTYGWARAASEARLVRVRLPSTALLYFGFPSAGTAGSVEADVVLGEDGLAHAVRFVRPVVASAGRGNRGGSQAP